MKSKTRTPIYTLILSLLAFAIYYRGLAPSVTAIFDDSLEFALVVHRLGIAHPTGYPLYILLGKLFSLFNLGNVAYQLNLMSAVFGALAVGLLYLAGLALQPDDHSGPAQHTGAALGALIFGVGPVFYSQSTIAEVYSLNAFFVAAILLAALKRRWYLSAFLFGLSLTHHRTIVLLLPAVGLYVAAAYHLTRREGWRHLRQDISPLKALIAFAAPLLLYLYLPWRGNIGTLEGDYQNTWAGFWRHINGGGYGAFLWGNPFNNERSAQFYLSLLKNELNWLGLAFSATGAGWLLQQRRWPEIILTGAAFLSYLTFNLFYTVTDIAVFFIPVFLLAALWAGAAMGALLDWIWLKNRWAAIGAGTALAILILFPQRGQSRANNWTIHDYALDALNNAAPNATVVGIQGEMTLLRYFQETNGLRPDIKTIRADLEGERLAKIEDLLAGNQHTPLYLTRELAGLPEKYALSATGPLIAVNAEPVLSQPSIDNQMDTALTPQITLIGYSTTRPETHQATDPLRLTLLWQPQQSISSSLKVSARLLNSAGEIVSSVDKTPVHFAYPTPFWRPGEFIIDVYDLQLPPHLPPGQYTPLIILYNPASNAAEVGRVMLTPVGGGE